MERPVHAYDLVIVGGGAAGFFAAANTIQARQSLILEKSNQPLAKVRISGGGRCNVTHACFDPGRLIEYYPRGAKELKSAFTRFQPRDTMSWFESRAVQLKIEEDGRVFPASDDSRSIVDCLMSSAKKNNSTLWQRAAVSQITRITKSDQARFLIRMNRPINDLRSRTGEKTPDIQILALNLLLATGSAHSGYALAESLGHTIIHPVPSLFTFEIQDNRLDGMAGLSVPMAKISLLPRGGGHAMFKQEGPLLITHWGISGPAVLRCSAWAARWLYEQEYRAQVEINWLSPLSLEQTIVELNAFKQAAENSRRTIIAHNPFPQLPTRLWQRLVWSAGMQDTDQWANLSKKSLLRVAQALCTGRYKMTGKGLFKDEFVTCGGVDLVEVDFRTMQSCLVPGLFFAGEILNIDGLTGGFNFQNAWTTAFIASQSICP